MRRHHLLGLTMLALTPACSGHSDDDAATAQAAAAPRAVSAARVVLRPMFDTLALSGILVSREEASVSSQLSGYPVARVYVDQDDEVRKGQALAQLDDTLLRADIAQQRAVVEQQRIAADKAGAEAGRVSGLSNAGVLSTEAIAERQLAARSAVASLSQAEAALQSLLVKQALMTIRAPVAGRILSRAVRPGDIAAPGTVMFRLERDDLVEVDAEVPEQSIGGIHDGQSATVVLPSGIELPGTVRLVSAEIDAQTKLGRARILMAANRSLRPGGFADVKLTTSRIEALAVPEAALRYDGSGASMMVLDDRNRVKIASFRTGVHEDGWVALADGPPAGTRVLTGGQSFVLNGDVVKPEMGQ